MIVVLKPHASDAEISQIEADVRELGYEPHTIHGVVRTVVAAVGDETAKQSLEILSSSPVVDRVIPIQKRYKLVSREAQHETTVIDINGTVIGSRQFHIIAGPCSVENSDQMLKAAYGAAKAGATLIRGGAFKPRTSPYDFQGLGDKALDILALVKKETGLPIVSEVIRETDIASMCQVVDVLQIGARNAMNYSLLEAVAPSGKPVLLKRGMASTIEEWLLAAEYLAKNGNPNVILCERGIRTFEKATRNTMDVSAIALSRNESNLPVFADPSHAAGRRDLIAPLSKAAIAAGAHGLMIEVHPEPEKANSDSTQQLTVEQFGVLVRELKPFIDAAGMQFRAKG